VRATVAEFDSEDVVCPNCDSEMKSSHKPGTMVNCPFCMHGFMAPQPVLSNASSSTTPGKITGITVSIGLPESVIPEGALPFYTTLGYGLHFIFYCLAIGLFASLVFLLGSAFTEMAMIAAQQVDQKTAVQNYSMLAMVSYGCSVLIVLGGMMGALVKVISDGVSSGIRKSED
jgi:hypothetical protein